jgi:hypothetical protein
MKRLKMGRSDETLMVSSGWVMLKSIMVLDATMKRRVLGTIFLLAAVGMLIAGLPAKASKLYWLGCFVFTMLAVITALRDVRALNAKAMKEQRGLLDATLRDIESDAKRKLQGNGKGRAQNSKDRRQNSNVE